MLLLYKSKLYQNSKFAEKLGNEVINHIYTVKKEVDLNVAQVSIDEFHHSMDKSMKATKI